MPVVRRDSIPIFPPYGVCCDQADLPAEQPASCQGARFPSAHAHPCRPCCPRGSSPQGPRSPLGLSHLPRGGTMLSSQHRLRASTDFDAVMRRGRAVRRAHLIVHVLAGSSDAAAAIMHSPARAGVAVSRAVGDSVTRHRVARRIRHGLQTAIRTLPAGMRIVVRALPSSAGASSATLHEELVSALSTVTRDAATQVSA